MAIDLITLALAKKGGGGGGGSDPNTVKYTAQSKSEEQKAVARYNIGAVNSAYVDNAVGNIDAELSTVAKTGAYSDLTGKPTKLSDLTNDANFATQSFVNSSVSDKQTKTITDTGSYFTTDTVEGALQEIGATLDGLDEALEALL